MPGAVHAIPNICQCFKEVSTLAFISETFVNLVGDDGDNLAIIGAVSGGGGWTDVVRHIGSLASAARASCSGSIGVIDSNNIRAM